MRVLITGIAGFIGSHLADALAEHEVYGIDDLSTGSAENVPHRWDRNVLSARDIRDGLPFDDWDLIYHCAASYKDRADWERDASVNVTGTINVVREAQRSGAKLVYFQTSLCYGPSPVSPVKTDAPLNPIGSYAVSKTAGEAYIRDSGVEYVSLRLANIYGPRNLSGPIPTLYSKLSAGEPCTVVDSRRDFVYIDDLVKVAVAAGTKGRGIYHVASGQDRSILEVYYAVAKAMGLEVAPAEVKPRGSDDVATILLDPTETLWEYGWAANTPLVHGIHEAVAWYQAHPPVETFTHLAVA